jgi:hypothetical protein
MGKTRSLDRGDNNYAQNTGDVPTRKTEKEV